jgi:AraC-like DNA-binding protein
VSSNANSKPVSPWEYEQSRIIRELVRGESRCLFSSAGLGWPSIMLEQHEILPEARPAAELSGFVLCLWNNRETMRCDHPDVNGSFVPKLVHPGTLSLYTKGALATVRTFEPWLGIFLTFKEDFLCEVKEKFQHDSNIRSVADGIISQDKRCFLDAPLERILKKLGEEARTAGKNGRLYAEELVQMLADRLLVLTHTHGKDWLTNKLDTRTMRRLSDRIEATPDTDLDLETLASETGCSKRHLILTFRASTGRSPHQYVLDLRIEKARRLMLKPSLNLIQIAMECGFKSDAHFTRAFRRRLGVPPSTFRRQL